MLQELLTLGVIVVASGGGGYLLAHLEGLKHRVRYLERVNLLLIKGVQEKDKELEKQLEGLKYGPNYTILEEIQSRQLNYGYFNEEEYYTSYEKEKESES